MNIDVVLFLILGSAFLALIYGVILTFLVLKEPAGNKKMVEIALAIQEGASAYLNRQYLVVGIVGIVIFFILWIQVNNITALGFAVGAIASALAGYIGISVAVRANVRTAQAAQRGLSSALNIAFRGGAVTGLMVVGLALLSVSGFYYLLTRNLNFEINEAIKALIGLGFGGSLISVFARLGGGIYTKGADVGADLVGKLESGIP